MKIYAVVKTEVCNSTPRTEIIFSSADKKKARRRMSKEAIIEIGVNEALYEGEDPQELEGEGMEVWESAGSFFYNLGWDRFFMYSSENMLLNSLAIEVMEIEL
jgi:hypothetical protein